MKKLKGFECTIEAVMAGFMALMGCLIFMNVVLRYFFNSGITWAEEFSRFLFVWLVFLGAIGALKDNNHLGFTSLVQALPKTAKKICYIVSNLMVLGCLYILFTGGFEMTVLTLHTPAPSTGIPLAYMYGVAILTSIGMFAVICCNLYRALFVKGAIDKLVVLKESEEEISVEKQAKGEVGQ